MHILKYKNSFVIGLDYEKNSWWIYHCYDQGYVSYDIVAHWVYWFSSERESLEDNFRNGCSIIVMNQQNIDVLNDWVNDDPNISID